MRVEVGRAEFGEVEGLKGLYREEAGCQIVHDSALRRGIADGYLVRVDGRVGGYGAVWNRYEAGRVVEFYVLPDLRAKALPLFREFLAASGATSIEAQTNMPLMLMLLYDCGRDIREDRILFGDGFTTQLPTPGGEFRRAREGEAMPDPVEELGEFVFETDGRVVATGGFLCHYNPPYGDVYMSVAEEYRRRGIGSYVVQEVKRACYEAGRKPAARCNPENAASRCTLQKAGMLPVGRLLIADCGLTDDRMVSDA